MGRRGASAFVLATAALLMAPAAHAAPARPDLVVTALAQPPATLQAGATFRVVSSVLNRGRGKARRSRLAFLLSKDRKPSTGDVRLTGARRVAALKRRQRRRPSHLLRVPVLAPAGDFFLIACVDRPSRLRESNERNNCRVARRRSSVRRPPAVPDPSPGPAPTVPDTTPPAAPTLTGTDPGTPGNDPTPNVKGSAEAGSTVALYKQAACAGPVVVSGPAATSPARA